MSFAPQPGPARAGAGTSGCKCGTGWCSDGQGVGGSPHRLLSHLLDTRFRKEEEERVDARGQGAAPPLSSSSPPHHRRCHLPHRLLPPFMCSHVPNPEADGRPITTIFIAIPFAATAVPSFLQPPDHRIRWL
uniref:Uncharacterized protein n=1 Tax=Oryza glumipatula TaxID=40148 RepID=A0A0E0AJN3_9ORYZ